MKFRPKLPDDRVNRPTEHPLIDFIKIVGGATVILVGLYWALGAFTAWMVPQISPRTEAWLKPLYEKMWRSEKPHEKQERLQELLSSLQKGWPESKDLNLTLVISNESEPNAFAIPGGLILVTQGLLDFVESENEMMMILGHEIGHFAHRHHLKSVGRHLGMALISIMVFGGDSDVARFFANVSELSMNRYSQKEESQADQFGLKLLVKHYGHAGGATSFFEKLQIKEGRLLPFQKFMSSHPPSKFRVKALKEWIQSEGYQIQKVNSF